MSSILVDFTQAVGPMKPLHGVNNSPIAYHSNLPELTDAGIPYVRTHDTGGAFGGAHLVDTTNVFPDFNADPANPDSYDFAFTDAYLQTLVNSGIKPFYRLGVTIENNYKIKSYGVIPPADFSKWAEICCGIVRHYNEGWANGFHYGIEYWEIWNEPESPAMWQGTHQQFFELYATAARRLHQEFPAIKLGGYGGSGFFVITRKNTAPIRHEYLSMFNEFLEFLRSQSTPVPFDFFSWHLYTRDIGELLTHARYVRKRLDEAGFSSTESIFDEWNYIEHDTCQQENFAWDEMRNMPGALFVGAVFSMLQKEHVDKAMLYDAMPTRKYCALYYYPEHKVSRTYYVFKIFNTLYQLGTCVYTECDEEQDGIYLCAATDGQGQKAMMVVNRNPLTKKLPMRLHGASLQNAELLLLDADRVLTPVNWLLNRKGSALTMPPLSIALIRGLD